MEIKEVKYVTDRPFPLDGSTKLPEPFFDVFYEDGSDVRVPPDPANRHYWEIREWYLNQPKRPFAFAFEPLPMPPKE